VRREIFFLFEFARFGRDFVGFCKSGLNQPAVRRGSGCGQSSIKPGSDPDQDYIFWPFVFSVGQPIEGAKGFRIVCRGSF
jgi:hypothetical protein